MSPVAAPFILPPFSPYLERRFEVLGVLGQGTFGTVFRVRDLLREKQECALKVAVIQEKGEEILQMFREEFRILASLEHSRIAKVYDFGTVPSNPQDERSTVFFTSELVQGAALFEASENLGLAMHIEILRQIAEALVYLSQNQIVHRDLKSSNILLDSSGKEPSIKIVDFGVAVEILRGQSSLTAGTVQYMAPEVLKGESFNSRSDLYALGVIAYYLLARRFPYEAETVFDMVRAHEKKVFTCLSQLRSDLPPGLVSSVNRLLAISPDERFFSAQQFLDELVRLFPKVSVSLTGPGEPAAAGAFPQLIGRDEELAALTSVFQAITSGRAEARPLCFIEGDLGLGKTKLLKAFKTSVQLKGCCVLEASSETVANGLRPVLQAWLEEVHSFLNQPSPPQKTLPVQTVWRGLLEESRKLPALGCPGMVFLLDNLHELEVSALEAFHDLFSELKRQRPLAPVMVVATRTPSSQNPESLDEILDHVLEGPSTCVLRLRPLDHAQIESAIGVMHRSTADKQALTEKILAWTGGSPLLVKEALSSPHLKPEVSQSVRDIFLRRLEAIDAEEGILVGLLAVIAEPVAFQVLREMLSAYASDLQMNRSAGHLLKSVNRLQALHIVRSELQHRHVMYALEHEFLRQIVYQKMQDADRAYLHRFVASYFESMDDASKKFRGKVLSHWLRGKDLDRVLELLPDEIVQCERDNDFARAIAILEDSLRLADSMGKVSLMRRVELAQETVRFCIVHGDLMRAAAHLTQVRSSPEFDALAKSTKATVLLLRAEVYQLMLKPQPALNCLQEVSDLLADSTLEAEKLRAVWIRGRVFYRLGAYEAMRQEADAHIEIALAKGYPREAAELLYNRGVALTSLGKGESALRDLLNSFTLMQNAGAIDRTIYPLNAMGLTYQILGRYQEALENYTRAYEVAACFSNNRLMINVAMNLATIHHHQGDFPLAQEFYERARDVAERTQQRGELARVLKNLGMLFLHFGHFSFAQEQFEKCLKIVNQSDLIEEKAWLHLYLGDVALAGPDLKKAREQIEMSLEHFRGQSIERPQITALQGIGAIATALGNLDEAAEILDEASAKIGDQDWPEERMVQNWRWAEYYLRRFAQKPSKDILELAQGHIQSAFDLARKLRNHRSLWMICALHAQIIESGGDRDEGQRLQRKALALAEDYARQIPDEYRHYFLNSPRLNDLRQKCGKSPAPKNP